MTLTQYTLEAPDRSHGVEIGVSDWKFSVEALLPVDNDALWDIAEWGNDDWGDLAWSDITDYVRGIDWQRGADRPHGRPLIGEAFVTLDGRDGTLSPLSTSGVPAYLAPGTIMRCGLTSEVEDLAWIPQWTMIVDSWSLYEAQNGADTFSEVRLYETLRDLSAIDENEQTSQGAGESAQARFDRILDRSDWRFGYLFAGGDVQVLGLPMLATTLSANRLTECYQTADSTLSVFRSARDGRAFATVRFVESGGQVTTEAWPLAAVSWIDYNVFTAMGEPYIVFGDSPGATTDGDDTYLEVAIDDGSIEIANDDEEIQNDARWARAGGTQQVAEETVSIGRFGRRTSVRSDLINDNDPHVLFVAENYVKRVGRSSLRVERLSVSATDQTDAAFQALTAADVGVRSLVKPPNASGVEIAGTVRSMRHGVTPRSIGDDGSARLTWRIEFAFDTTEVTGIPGATLPTEF